MAGFFKRLFAQNDEEKSSNQTNARTDPVEFFGTSSDPRRVEQVLHDTATLPGNFNPNNGRWESVENTSSTRRRTRLVFDPETKKLLAVDHREAVDDDTEMARKIDGYVGVDMAAAGYFTVTMCHMMQLHGH